jgi:hypothetical protein
MSTAAAGTVLGRRKQTAARRGGMRSGVVYMSIRESVQRRAGPAPVRQTPVARAALTHRVRQGDQVVLVGIGGKRAGVAHEFPSPGRGDPAGVADAQIP